MAGFASDMRCQGGQKQVKDLMQSHYSAMINVKPTLNTRAPPKKHISQKGRPQSSKMIKPLDDQLITGLKFSEQRETFKRVANIKSGGTDSSKPKTFAKSKALQRNRAFNQNNHAQEEHLRNLAALQKRMNAVGSKQERMKNKWDPLSNPVYFFRKGEENQVNL